MKKIAGLFLVFGFVLASPVIKLHAQGFEGTITWSMTIPMLGDDEKHPMVMNMKGDKSETEVDMGMMGNMKSYKDGATKKMYMVMGSSKSGFVMDMKDLKSSDPIEVKATGNKETIAGHPAEEYSLKGQKGVDISLWMTADMPKDIQESFFNAIKDSPNQDPNVKKAMKQLADKGLVMVRIVMKDAGETQMTMEFVKYEKKSLDDSFFVPPADVKFGPMPAGMGGMN